MLGRLRSLAAADAGIALPLSRPNSRPGSPTTSTATVHRALARVFSPRWSIRRKRVVLLLFAILVFFLTGMLRLRSNLRTRADASEHPHVLYAPAGWERSFDEPDYELNLGPFPHEIECNKKGKLAFMGIFSTAEGRQRRDLLRKHILPDYDGSNIEVKFILARPNLNKYEEGYRPEKNAELKLRIKEEMEEHGDLIVLPTIDNIDEGKTFEYFKYMATHYADDPPQFVMKADDDSIWSVPNLVSSLSALDCSKGVYWGTSAGSSTAFLPYFRGMGYAVSWPLVPYLARTTLAHIFSIEDARVSQHLRQLDPVTDPVQRVDMGHNMADWNQVNTTINTVCLHWLKDDEWVLYNHHRLQETWRAANRTYAPGNGVPLAELLKSGETHVPPTECFGWYSGHCARPEDDVLARWAARRKDLNYGDATTESVSATRTEDAKPTGEEAMVSTVPLSTGTVTAESNSTQATAEAATTHASGVNTTEDISATEPPSEEESASPTRRVATFKGPKNPIKPPVEKKKKPVEPEFYEKLAESVYVPGWDEEPEREEGETGRGRVEATKM